jgi:non-homologous end joining protein Ku
MLDLMEALKASLGGEKKPTKEKGESKRKVS